MSKESQRRLVSIFDAAMKLRNMDDLRGAKRLLESLVPQLDVEDRDLLSHTHAQLGYICKLLRNQSEREAHFRAAVAAAPDYDLPSLGLFEALYDQGRHTEALQEMLRLLRISYSRDYADIASQLDSDQLTEEERRLLAEVRQLVVRYEHN